MPRAYCYSAHGGHKTSLKIKKGLEKTVFDNKNVT